MFDETNYLLSNEKRNNDVIENQTNYVFKEEKKIDCSTKDMRIIQEVKKEVSFTAGVNRNVLNDMMSNFNMANQLF
jgi:predicted TIM-barrel enzyme